MKIFKKFLAAVLACSILLTLSACHGKNEVALTIEGIDITSALYLNALVDCDSEAKQRVDDEIAAAKTEETEENKAEEETDYYSKTLDGLSFVEYVKNKAIERCKEFVFYQKLADEGTIELSDEAKNTAESYAQYYWYQGGYAYLYEVNGVSFETYKKAFTYSYYSNEYFNHLYNEGGEKEVPKKDINTKLLEDYTLAHVITETYEEKATDEQKAALKTKLEGYAKRLKEGETFEKIYTEHSGKNESEHNHSDEKDGPKVQHATIMADKNAESNYANPNFDTVYDMKVGDIQVVESEDKTSISLLVKLDIGADEYYYKTLKDTILYELKEKEFQNYVTEKTKNYKVDENTYATNRFDVEDIDYSVLEGAYAAANQGA